MISEGDVATPQETSPFSIITIVNDPIIALKSLLENPPVNKDTTKERLPSESSSPSCYKSVLDAPDTLPRRMNPKTPAINPEIQKQIKRILFVLIPIAFTVLSFSPILLQ